MDYFARYTTRTQFSISGAPGKPEELKDFIEVQLPDGEMMIYDRYREVDSEDLHQGLVFDVSLDGVGESYAREWANRIRSLISFTVKTEMPRLKLEQEFQDGETCDFEQRHLVAEPFIAKDTEIEMDMELFNKINRCWSIKYDEDREVFDALDRAVKYFAKSLEQESSSDRFTMLYLSLEALGNKLLKFYDQQPDSGINEHDGVDSGAFPKLFEDVEGVEFEQDIYKKGRNNLFHEAEEAGAIEFVDELEEGVQRGILTLLGIDYGEYEDTLRREPVRNRRDLAIRFTGTISGYSIPTPEIGLNIPRIDTSDIQRVFNWDVENGELTVYMAVDGELVEDFSERMEERFVQVRDEELEVIDFSKGYRG